jgi:hypothetical protein
MKKGFALTSLIIFTTIGLTAVASAMYLIVDSFQLTSSVSLSEEVLRLAESGIEEGAIQLARNPAYAGGTVTVGTDSVSISVTGTSTKTILSSASKYGIIRTAQKTL